MTNQMWGFYGGVAEFVPEGKAMLPDRDTGELKEVVWSNHIRITAGRTIHKFKYGELKAIVELMLDKDFVAAAKQCP